MDEFLEAEANRCLLCKKARCSMACPASTAVPDCMKLFREGKYYEAGELLFRNNPFSIITSRVCDWKKFCYGHCVLNHKQQAVHWYQIEQFLSEEFLMNYHPAPIPAGPQKVAIVGAGPAGIAAAIRLREAGYDVTLLDDNAAIGGVLRYGIPEFRLSHRYILEFERILKEYGIHFIPGQRLGKNLHLPILRKQYDAILIAAGAGKYRKLDIPGEDDNPAVLYALEYLKEPTAWQLGKKVIVIGGGNVTMDASRTALRQGCDTYVYYRKTFENMPANEAEVKEAQQEGVKFVLFEVPVAIKNSHTAVMIHCENVVKEDGRIATRMIPGTEHEVDFDNMIVAISENVDFSLFEEEKLEFNESGWPMTGENQQTSLPDVFLAGDFLLGPKTVVEAVASANIAVQGIISYLKEKIAAK